MFEEEEENQGINEEDTNETPELERNQEENNDQPESEELDQDEEELERERNQDEINDQPESEELVQDEEDHELEGNEDGNNDQPESEELNQEEKQIDGIEETEYLEKNVENNQENIEQEILADLEEINKEIDNLPSENELINEEREQEEVPTVFEENTNNISGEEITQESIEEFIEQDKSESEENSVMSEELSAEELVSEEIDEKSRRKNIVEGALFVAGRPISLEELNIKTEIRKKDLEESLEELMLDYLMRATSLEIVQIQDKFSLQIKPEYTPNVKKFATGGLIPDRHLKTLTIIALKQPILKSKLVKIRGSGAYEHVKFLLDRGFINAIKKGRSYELMTTENFS